MLACGRRSCSFEKEERLTYRQNKDGGGNPPPPNFVGERRKEKMKKSKKIITAMAMLAMASVAFPMATRAINVSASTGANLSWKHNFTQIEDQVWLDDEIQSYYGVSDLFPYVVASMEAWVTLDSNVATGADYGVLFSNFNSFADTPTAEYEFRITADRYLHFESGVDGFPHTFTGYQIPVGERVHIAFVNDFDDGSLKLYINGALVDTREDITLLDEVTYMRYRVGTNEGGIANRNAFKGDIHQVTVYGSPIDAETIALDMAQTDITTEQRVGLDLMANWSITDKRAWRVEDTSGNDNHLLYHTQGAYVPATFSESIDYSFVMVPDTQGLVLWQQDRFSATVNWIKDNKDALNISYVMHMGDITNGIEREEKNPDEMHTMQWTRASNYMSVLDGVVPYSFVLGNHDYDLPYGNLLTRDTNYFNSYFPYSKFSAREDFGGVYEANKMDNAYYTFTAGEAEYLIFALEYSPRSNVLRWASDVIKAHPYHRVIITTHALLGTHGAYNYDSSSALHGQEGNSGSFVWKDLISKHPNVMMAFGGHESQHNLTMRLDEGDNGNKVFSMLVDFQSFHMGNLSPAYQYDEAFVAVMGIDDDAKKAYIYLVNAETNTLYNAQNCIVYDFADDKNTALNGAKEQADTPSGGCKSSLATGFSGMSIALSLGLALMAKKGRENEN